MLPLIFVTSNDELYVTEDNEPLSNDDEIVMPINPEGEELSWYWGKATFNESKHISLLSGRQMVHSFTENNDQH